MQDDDIRHSVCEQKVIGQDQKQTLSDIAWLFHQFLCIEPALLLSYTFFVDFSIVFEIFSFYEAYL